MSEEHTTARWSAIKQVFNVASALDAREREAYLATACSDEALREEVRALLAAHDDAGPLDRLMDDVMAPLQRRVAASSMEGRRIGPYRVGRELGRGGMGRVYRARDVRLERDVALKFLPADRHASAALRERWMQEARAVSALDHPNICTVYDVGETDAGEPYIAMACYDGQTLAERIEAGPVPVDEALDLTRQIAEGLASAHAAGITHRDVKPSIVMVTARGTVKILDFGIARREGQARRTRSGARLGTVAYMAPEQVRGEAVDARTDLWALGVVLYEMLTGRHPFLGASETATIYAILEREPPPAASVRPDVPPALAAVLERLLAKAPEARYRRAEALLEALERVRRAPTTSDGLRPRALPAMLTSFVGRADEVAQVERLLAHARLVTLTGPAGTGKTRLALEVAARRREDFADGVGFVSLASVSDPGLVASAVAQALGVATGGAQSPHERLKHVLRRRELLLVLDNFEHVAAAAPVVAELLVACPALKLIATSRVPLRISGEHEFPVPPLALGAADAARHSASVQLFVERARSVRPDFALTDESAADVAELCRRLDGLPLAIELAAARVKLFAPRAMLARLEDRFELLKGGPRDLPARHQTLREAVAWSYDLLDEAEQRLFRCMAVFVGGATLAAIEAVSDAAPGAVLDGVAALVDHSLVRQDEDGTGEPRFLMLETIRAYGRERLSAAGELEATRARHAAYFRDFAEHAAEKLTGADQTRWLDRLEEDHGNLRAALRWAVDRSAPDVALRLGAALWRFWIARGHLMEGRQWLDRLYALPAADALLPTRARVLHGRATVAHNQGDNEEARSTLEKSLELWRALGDEHGTALALNNLAWVDCETSAFDRAEARAREAEALCRRLGDRRGVAVALNNLGWVANYRGLYRAAVAFHRESLDLRRALGDERGIAFALTNLAWAETYHGDYARAEALLDEAAAVAERAKDAQQSLWIDVLRGRAARERGAAEQAVALLERCLARWTEGGNKSIRAWTLWALAGAYVDVGECARAEAFLRESRPLWGAIGCAWGEAVVACEEGRIARATGDVERARDRFAAGWRLHHRLADRRGGAECLEGLAASFAEGEAASHAVRLLAAAHTLRAEIEAPLPACYRLEHERHVAALRRQLGAEAFERLWREGATRTPEEVARPVLA